MDELNETHNRRKCDQCNKHPFLEKDIADFITWIKEHSVYSEKVQERIGDRVKISQFRYVSSGLGGLLLVILIVVLTLYSQNGNMRVEISDKINVMRSDQREAIASEKASRIMIQKQVDHIAAIQVNVTHFIGEHQAALKNEIDRVLSALNRLDQRTKPPIILSPNIYKREEGGSNTDPTQ